MRKALKRGAHLKEVNDSMASLIPGGERRDQRESYLGRGLRKREKGQKKTGGERGFTH